MANSSSGIYGGFSYLSSPTDKNPPRSPRLSAKSDYRNSDQSSPQDNVDTDRQPFTYLTPNSPIERSPSPLPPVFDQHESYDNNQRLPREADGSVHMQAAKPFDIPGDRNRVGSQAEYYTNARDFSKRNSDNDNVVGELYNNRIIDDRDKNSAYIVPDYMNGGRKNQDYELAPTGGKGGDAYLPRPRVGGSSGSGGGYEPRTDDFYQNRGYHYEQEPPVSPTSINGKFQNRPLTRDSHLDTVHKKKKSQCSCGLVFLIVVLVILALGSGFVAGWFVSQVVNGDNGTEVTTTTNAMVTTVMGMSTTTTTVNPAPPEPTTSPTTTPVTTPPTPVTTPTTTTTTAAIADESTTGVTVNTTATP